MREKAESLGARFGDEGGREGIWEVTVGREGREDSVGREGREEEKPMASIL